MSHPSLPPGTPTRRNVGTRGIRFSRRPHDGAWLREQDPLAQVQRVRRERHVVAQISAAPPPSDLSSAAAHHHPRTPSPSPLCSRAGAGGASRNLFVEKADSDIIQRIAAETPARVAALLAGGDSGAAAYAGALLRVLETIFDVRVVQYALTLIVDFLEVDAAGRARYFLVGGAGGVLPFLQLAGVQGSGARVDSLDVDPYILEYASRAAALVLSVDQSDPTTVVSMLSWVQTSVKQFGSSSPRQVKVIEASMEALMVLLRAEYFRNLFVEQGGISRILPMLTSLNPQLV